ncbi:MAG: DnaJ domain-containing protein [Sandarakinorhabdus sp.]|nr:DnaJ domain-containing protein [Sandarakinorhabdus sp.]
MRDPYKVLGVARGASDADIKKAYRKLAKENHPDRNADNVKKLELFKEANSAYEMLSDSEKKGRFDRGEIGADGNPTSPFAGGFSGGGGRAGGDPFARSQRPQPGGFDFAGGADDIFSELFGGGRSPFSSGSGGGGGGFRTQQKGADVSYRLTVTFDDAANLAPQRVTLKGGKTVELKLPTGFEPGRQLRMAGQGEAGPGGSGDALVTLEVGRHKFFTRDGDDIRLDLPVTLNEAVLGAKVRMPTVTGAVTLTLPPGTTSGKVFRLKARGFSRADGSRGDQLVTVIVDLPTDDSALKAFAENWHDTRGVRRELGV